MTRILSLWFPYLATDRIQRLGNRHAKAPDRRLALATIAKVKNAQRLVAVNAQAKARGLSTGLMLADARARVPDLIVHQADAGADAQLLDHSLDWCRRYTPLAARDAPDGILLDITGAAHLFGGETALLADIEARLAAQGFTACAAIAPTAEAAWALAHYSDRRILPDGDEQELTGRLGELPLAALRLDAQTLSALAQAGLRRIDDILYRPRAPLTARFGAFLFARLDGLLGRIKSPISPSFETPAYLTERRFAEPIIMREAVEGTIMSLAQDLAQILTRHGTGARRLEASLFRVDGVVKHISAGTSRPLRTPQTIARLFHEKLEAACAETQDDPLDAGFGFDVLRLSALVVERQDEEQTHWCEPRSDAQDLADLIDRLGARFGLRRVTRLTFVDTHWPEFAVTAVPASSYRSPRSAPSLLPDKQQIDEKIITHPSRPIRLLQYPEPIETLAHVPDGPPLRFRWRRVLHEIAAIEGPERLAPEWWKGATSLTRDYFRAEDTQGRRFWLFREGLYEVETQAPRWFMHGLFA